MVAIWCQPSSRCPKSAPLCSQNVIGDKNLENHNAGENTFSCTLRLMISLNLVHCWRECTLQRNGFTKPGALLARMHPTRIKRDGSSDERFTRRRLHPHPRDIQSWWSARSIQTYPERALFEPGGLRCASNGHDAGPAFVLRFSSLEPPCQQPIESLQPFNYRASQDCLARPDSLAFTDYFPSNLPQLRNRLPSRLRRAAVASHYG